MTRPAIKASFVLSHRNLPNHDIIAKGARQGVVLSSGYVSKVLRRAGAAAARPARAATQAATRGAAALQASSPEDQQLLASFRALVTRIGTDRAQEWLTGIVASYEQN